MIPLGTNGTSIPSGSVNMTSTFRSIVDRNPPVGFFSTFRGIPKLMLLSFKAAFTGNG